MNDFELADTSIHSSKAAIIRCYLGKLLYVVSGTSNWTGECGFTCEDLDSLKLKRDEAERWIDEKNADDRFVRRKKGTYWWLWELPVVVVQSDSVRLVIVQPSWDFPLDEYHFALPAKKNFGSLAKALMDFVKKDQYALKFSVHVPIARFPFLRLRNPSSDQKQAVKDMGDPIPRWVNESEFKIDATPAIQIVCDICLWLAK